MRGNGCVQGACSFDVRVAEVFSQDAVNVSPGAVTRFDDGRSRFFHLFIRTDLTLASEMLESPAELFSVLDQVGDDPLGGRFHAESS